MRELSLSHGTAKIIIFTLLLTKNIFFQLISISMLEIKLFAGNIGHFSCFVHFTTKPRYGKKNHFTKVPRVQRAEKGDFNP